MLLIYTLYYVIMIIGYQYQLNVVI